MNALIVGAGKFGYHYVRLLATLDSERYGIPKIDDLVFSNTSEEKQRKSFLNLPAETIGHPIGEVIADERDLQFILDEYKPGLTIIAAKDRKIGDNIHPPYVYRALSYGAVLCEKPFANACGDGASVEGIERKLNSYEHFFGLELPFAVAARDLKKRVQLWQRFTEARHIDIFWGSNGNGMLLDDLALHPWSLLADFHPEIFSVSQTRNSAKISLILQSPDMREVTCDVKLSYERNFSGIKIYDKFSVMKPYGYCVGIKRQGIFTTMVEISHADYENATNEQLHGKVLLQVKNPVKQHIIALLQGKPIVGVKETVASQLFLERLQGYRG